MISACGPYYGPEANPPSLGSIYGHVHFFKSLGREQAQRINVIAGYSTNVPCYDLDPARARETSFEVRDAPTDSQPFGFDQLPDGVYDVWAFRDTNHDGQFDVGGSNVLAKGPDFYFYAHIQDSDYTWQAGPDEPSYDTTLVALDGLNIPVKMRWVALLDPLTIDGVEYWEFAVNCDNY